ncbi:unnamed protein product [Paramecium sonneborni]|uniref:Transmembrane protein n=1 Tax=Paramecium sonneborni TaxID=65129 RepID=A0A8S1N3M5_9CILI|nr:unnamed protein product [Paramecium sonneborni]
MPPKVDPNEVRLINIKVFGGEGGAASILAPKLGPLGLIIIIELKYKYRILNKLVIKLFLKGENGKASELWLTQDVKTEMQMLQSYQLLVHYQSKKLEDMKGIEKKQRMLNIMEIQHQNRLLKQLELLKKSLLQKHLQEQLNKFQVLHNLLVPLLMDKLLRLLQEKSILVNLKLKNDDQNLLLNFIQKIIKQSITIFYQVFYQSFSISFLIIILILILVQYSLRFLHKSGEFVQKFLFQINYQEL